LEGVGGEKVSTTLRLDLDAVALFEADGPGWQGRIDATLRKAVGFMRKRMVFSDMTFRK
jgi:uncharacterized protein (DUF4415 family)